MKLCLHCKLPGEFGICRARKDGLNAYCKGCIRDKVYASRKLKNEMKLNRKLMRSPPPVVERKPEVMSPTIGAAIKRVTAALVIGYHTREAIKAATKLPMDHVCDALAILSSNSEIKFKRVDGEARFYPIEIVKQESIAA
jgi:hypothetical protein